MRLCGGCPASFGLHIPSPRPDLFQSVRRRWACPQMLEQSRDQKMIGFECPIQMNFGPRRAGGIGSNRFIFSRWRTVGGAALSAIHVSAGVLRGTPGRPHSLPGCRRAPRSAIAEDCDRLLNCFSFPKHHLGGEARSERLLFGILLLCKDVVPLVVMELSLFSPRCKFIGEAAYTFSIGSFGGAVVILPFLRIWTVVFAVHCAFSPQ